MPAGAIASVPLAEVQKGGTLSPTVIFAPNPRQSVDQVVATKDRLVLVYNDNVRGRMAVYTPGTGGWTATPVALPDN
ncbi:hypothetical protein, partial [Clostridium perfringens]